MDDLSTKHLTIVKQILRYLKWTIHHGILMIHKVPDYNLPLIAYDQKEIRLPTQMIIYLLLVVVYLWVAI